MEATSESRPRAMYCATPILYLNMGGEMLYVLQQRLQTQSVAPDKTIQVMNDVIYALLNPKQLHSIFEPGPLMGLASLRAVLERVVLSSIMKLDENSMGKLFDLMIMMVKYQLATATGPRELIMSTLNHVDAVRDMAVDRNLTEHVDLAHRLVVDTYGNMTYKEVWQIRNDCLLEIQAHNVRVTILLKLGMQNCDASFNRLFQRYDDKYQERKEVLQNVKLSEYNDEEGVLGSFALYGERVTLLGRNVYSSSYGHVHSSRSSQNLQQMVAVSNKAMRQELETMATQLGKEETVPKRMFTLHLFTQYDNDKNMDCSTASEIKTDNSNNVNTVNKDKEGNLTNPPVNEYKNNLIKDVDSEFDEAPRTEAMDLMKFFDVI